MGLMFPKPARGSGLLEREAADHARKLHERKVGEDVRRRDVRCRWPEDHTCRGGALEAAHIVNKSLGGETSTENELLLCPWMHRRGPETLHGAQLKIEKESPAGANGPLSFWKQDGGFDALGQPTYFCVARERSVGLVERD